MRIIAICFMFAVSCLTAFADPLVSSNRVMSGHMQLAQAREIYSSDRRIRRDDRRLDDSERSRSGSSRLSTDQQRSINDAILQQRILTSPALRQ